MANTRSHRRTFSQGVESRPPPHDNQRHVEARDPPRDLRSLGAAPPPQGPRPNGNDVLPPPVAPQEGHQPSVPLPMDVNFFQPTNQAGTSQQPPPMVSWAEYEALRHQHLESMQALRDMAGLLQDMVPGGTLPSTIRRFIPETG